MNLKWETNTVGDNGCPCGNVKWKGFEFHTHCWKTGMCCQYSGVHIQKYPKGQLNKAKKIAKMLSNYISKSWITECEVNINKYQ